MYRTGLEIEQCDPLAAESSRRTQKEDASTANGSPILSSRRSHSGDRISNRASCELKMETDLGDGDSEPV
jgi:hypothetical protein